MNGSRLPPLGRRGEGWFAGQLVLVGAVALAGILSGPDWAGLLLVVGRVVGAAFAVGGVVLGAIGARDLGTSLTPLPQPKPGAELVESGIYAHVRHPLYVALVIAALGWALFRASLMAVVLTGALALFLDLKARREEAWLRERYPGYAGYAARVRRFVPGLY